MVWACAAAHTMCYASCMNRQEGPKVKVAKTVVGLLAVACFAGGGYLVAGVHQSQPAPAQVDRTKVWNDLQQRRDQLQRDLQQQGPATPTPVPTNTERSV